MSFVFLQKYFEGRNINELHINFYLNKRINSKINIYMHKRPSDFLNNLVKFCTYVYAQRQTERQTDGH